MSFRISIPLCGAGTLRAFELRVVGGGAQGAASSLNSAAGAARHFQAVPGGPLAERVVVVALIHTREAFAGLLNTMALLIRGASSTLAVIPGCGWRIASADEASAALGSAVGELLLASSLGWAPFFGGLLTPAGGGGVEAPRLRALRIAAAPHVSAGSSLICAVTPLVLARLRAPPELAPLVAKLAELRAADAGVAGVSFEPFAIAAAPDFATGLLHAVHLAQPEDAATFAALCNASALPPYLAAPEVSPIELVGEVHMRTQGGAEADNVRFVPLQLIFSVGALLAPAGAALGAEISGAFATALSDAVRSLRALLLAAPPAPSVHAVIDEEGAARWPPVSPEATEPAPTAPAVGQPSAFTGWQTALELERGGALPAECAAADEGVEQDGPPPPLSAHVHARPTVRIELEKAEQGGEVAEIARPPQRGPAASAPAVRPPATKPAFATFARGRVAGVPTSAAATAPAAARPKSLAKAAPAKAAPAKAPAEKAPAAKAPAALDAVASDVASRKRKPPPQELDQAALDADVLRLHSSGALGTLGVPALKAYLRAHKVPGGLGGVKAALLERVAAHLTSAAGTAKG